MHTGITRTGALAVTPQVDDDVAVNVGALADYLEARRKQSNMYIGCMKSGEVLIDKRWKW